MSYGYLVVGGQKIEIETWRHLRHLNSGRDYILYVPTKPPRTPAMQPSEVVAGVIPTTRKHGTMTATIPAGWLVTAGTLRDLVAYPLVEVERDKPVQRVKLGLSHVAIYRICSATELALGLPWHEPTRPYRDPTNGVAAVQQFRNLLHQANLQGCDLAFDREDDGYWVRYTNAKSETFLSLVKLWMTGR
jgi:hypothetical protein